MPELNPTTNPATLPADLPENWTRGQVVAPDGSAVGLTEQHGYNYLMQQVNQTQQLVNAQGAVIQMLREELSNKVDLTYDWYDLELQNGFITFSGATPQFCIIGGVVHFRGVLCHESGETPLNTVIAELPEGFRPSYTAYVPVSLSSASGGGFARLGISSNGAMQLAYTSNQQSMNINFNLTFCYAI